MRTALVGALALALLPLGSLGAQTAESPDGTTTRVTAGIGVSYVGLGVVGELKPASRPISVLLGAGGLPGYEVGGASAGLRLYAGTTTPLYVQAMGALVPETYGPAFLMGIGSGGPTEPTFNLGIGIGRRVSGSWGIAFDFGLGWSWPPT